MARIFTPLLTSIITILLISACTQEDLATQNPASPSEQAELVEETKISDIKDQGDFQLILEDIENPKYQKYEEWVLAYDFEEELEIVNSYLALPHNIPVVFIECDEANAWYDLDYKEIWICYEFFEEMEELFTHDAETDEDLEALEVDIIDNIFWTFYHEMGHALADAYNLEFENEEDAADELSTIILINSGEIGQEAAVAGAWSFLISSEVYDQIESDEGHSYDADRFENILCWLYGNNPHDYNWFIEEEVITEDRIHDCDNEYQKVAQKWEELLRPHLKKEIDF